ncbi:hypothetical protein PR202_ga12077 [Eleusine coracana subsp. coracana]|uniref:C2 tensin-type domain-containing protein n=1 Tax=Eleusine coracana subsp. coracana TaxID=191504 RepID=A0AAV5CAP4_ELECO|nr:hypothetical protein PR202_ga12077 [Eleusine coracana subsp. coracana]
MALFRRLFYRKPPDRLLEIADRVYVFDCCFSTETMDQYRYQNYLDGIIFQLREQFADSSLMVLNFRDEGKSLVSGIFSLYRITVKDYPCQYLGRPILPLDVISHFLRLSERWLMLEGQQNILLVHCEKGGWPVLAFMLAVLLLYRKQYKGEQRTLDMADNVPVKLNVGCFVQGDVVLECLHVNDGLDDERLMFRVMFNTFFIQSHVLLLNFEDIDVPWNADHQFTKNFKAEVLFSEFDAESDASTEAALDDDDNEEMEAGSADEFFEAEEIFSNAGSHDGQKDADMLSVASTDNSTPSAEPRKSSPFFNFELDIDIDELQDSQFDGIGLSLETVNDEKACTYTEAKINNKAAVVNSNLLAGTIGDGDSGISSSTCTDKENDSTFESGSPKPNSLISFSQNLSQIDNVLVKEVIISETNSPKDIQMIKEVIISEVTTPKQVVEGNKMKNELVEAVDNSESPTFGEVENKEHLNIVVKQDGGSRENEYVTYENGLVVKQENRSEEKLSISDSNILVYEPSDEDNWVERPSSGEQQLQSSSTSPDVSSAEKEIKQLHAVNSNDPVKPTEEMDIPLTSSRRQPSNISPLKILPVRSIFAAKLAPTSVNAQADSTDSSRLVLKKKAFLPLSTCSLFAPSSPRRNLLRSTSADLSSLSPSQTESRQTSVASTSGKDAVASSSAPPPPRPRISLIPSIKVPALVHPPLRPIRTVASLPSSSFEAFLDLAISSCSTSHTKHQEHVNPHSPPIPPPQQLHVPMTKETYLHSCGLTLPASSSYAPHPQDPPPLAPLPNDSCSQSDSSSPTYDHEQRRDDGSCSCSPDCRQTVLDLGDFSLTSPSKSSVGTIECLSGSSNFADEEVASRPGILMGMDTVTCFSLPKLSKYRALPPPMPPPLPPLPSSSQLPYQEEAMLPKPQSPALLTSREGSEASKVSLLESAIAAELSSSERSEYTVEHMSGSTKDTASSLLPSIPATPACLPFHGLSNDPSISTAKEVPFETCKEISQSEIINQGKEHGGLPIMPPPPELPQPREHMKPPSAAASPPPPPPPPTSNARLGSSPCSSLPPPSPREHSENSPSPPPPPFLGECFVESPPPLLPNRPSRPRKHINPNTPPSPLSPTGNVIIPAPPPPPLHPQSVVKHATTSPFSEDTENTASYSLSEDHLIASPPPSTPAPPPPPIKVSLSPPPSHHLLEVEGQIPSPTPPDGGSPQHTFCEENVEILPELPLRVHGGVPLSPPTKFQERDSASQPSVGLRETSQSPPPPPPPPLLTLSTGHGEDPSPPPPPRLCGGVPPPPPPLPGGYIGAPPPPPHPGGYIAAPPHRHLLLEDTDRGSTATAATSAWRIYRVSAATTSAWRTRRRDPPPAPPAGFRGGAPPPPSSSWMSRTDSAAASS